MEFNRIIKQVAERAYGLMLSTCLVVVALGFFWSGTFLPANASAIAGPYNSHPENTATYPQQGKQQDDALQELREDARAMRNDAKATIDRVTDSDQGNQIEGKAKWGIGRAKRGADQAADQAKGLSKQAEGRVQQDAGRAKNVFEKIGDRVEDASRDAADSIKDAVGN